MSAVPTIVLLHGWATDPGLLDSVHTEIESHSMSATVYEMPGYGSRRGENGKLTFDALVDDAISHLPTDAIWVGWSLGAMLALSAAAKMESSVTAVLGICSTAKFCGDPHKAESLVQLRQAVENDPEKAVTRFQRSMPSSANRRSVAKQLSELQPPKSESDHHVASKETLLAGLDILSRADLTEEVNKINVPVRLISGDDDPIIPASAAIELNGLIPGSQFTVLPCGHLPFLECPQLFMEQLFDFAQTIAGSPTGSKSV